MTHEPECDYKEDNGVVHQACLCPILRAAYKRGREDAAVAVGNALHDDGNPALVTVSRIPWLRFCVRVIAAARGGEQE